MYLQSVVVAVQQFAVVAVEVHAAAQTVAEHLAVGACAAPRPIAVAEGFEAVLPHVPEFIPVDVALMEVGTDRRAARNGAVDTSGSMLPGFYRNSGTSGRRYWSELSPRTVQTAL